MDERAIYAAGREMCQAAYVMSQSIAAMAKIQGMVAENQHNQFIGRSVVYGQEQFEAVIGEFGLHHDSILTSLQPVPY